MVAMVSWDYSTMNYCLTKVARRVLHPRHCIAFHWPPSLPRYLAAPDRVSSMLHLVLTSIDSLDLGRISSPAL